MTDVPDVLFTPDPQSAGRTRIATFARSVGRDPLDYAALHRWSVTDLAGFWGAAAEFLGVRFTTEPNAVLGSSEMPGTPVFPRRHPQLRRARPEPRSGPHGR